MKNKVVKSAIDREKLEEYIGCHLSQLPEDQLMFLYKFLLSLLGNSLNE